jgi:hypothetical protein
MLKKCFSLLCLCVIKFKLEMLLPVFHQLNGGLINEATISNSMRRFFLFISHYGVYDYQGGTKRSKPTGGIQMDIRQ